MATKCNICKKTKDREKDYYESNKSICIDCVKLRSNKRKKEAKMTTMVMLETLLENQNIIINNQKKILERVSGLESSMESVDNDIEKITRRLKKLSTF